MFIKLSFVFPIFLLVNEYTSQGTNATTSEPEKMVQVPQSLIEDLLKKRDDLDGLKELLSLISSSNGTNITKTSTKRESLRFPIRRLIVGIRNLITNLKERIQTAKNMSFYSTSQAKKPYRTRRVAKFLFILRGLQADLEEMIKIGRELKPVWNAFKEFLKEEHANAEK